MILTIDRNVKTTLSISMLKTGSLRTSSHLDGHIFGLYPMKSILGSFHFELSRSFLRALDCDSLVRNRTCLDILATAKDSVNLFYFV